MTSLYAPVKPWKAKPGSLLAKLRMRGHKLIDLKVEFGGKTMSEVYRQLATDMGVPGHWCHFSCFDEAHCEHAIAILEEPDWRG